VMFPSTLVAAARTNRGGLNTGSPSGRPLPWTLWNCRTLAVAIFRERKPPSPRVIALSASAPAATGAEAAVLSAHSLRAWSADKDHSQGCPPAGRLGWWWRDRCAESVDRSLRQAPTRAASTPLVSSPARKPRHPFRHLLGGSLRVYTLARAASVQGQASRTHA
jgi:hypothetical protein